MIIVLSYSQQWLKLINKKTSNNFLQDCGKDGGLPTERRFAPVSVENHNVEEKYGILQE